MKKFASSSLTILSLLFMNVLPGCLIFNDPMPSSDTPLHEVTEEERELLCLDICEEVEPYSLTCYERGKKEESSITFSRDPAQARHCEEHCEEGLVSFAQLGCDMDVGEYRRLHTRVRTCEDLDEITERLFECLDDYLKENAHLYQ